MVPNIGENPGDKTMLKSFNMATWNLRLLDIIISTDCLGFKCILSCSSFTVTGESCEFCESFMVDSKLSSLSCVFDAHFSLLGQID